jgi:hypothetical protein
LDEPHFYDYDNLMNRKAKGKETVECDESFDDVLVNQILEGVYNEKLTISELVVDGEIREAIDVLERSYPNDAILLLARYNKGLSDYNLSLLSMDDWKVEKQKIGNSLLEYEKKMKKEKED